MFEWMRTKKVLVTGGVGFIGTHVTNALKEQGIKVASIIGPPEIDLCGEDDTWKIITRNDPDAVIHLAAIVGGIQMNEKEPATMFHENMVMSMNVAQTCARAKIPMIFAGSPCSYPENAPMPLKEEYLWCGYPARPNDAYGVSKLAILAYMRALHKELDGWRSVYLIPFNTYGPGDHLDPERSHVLPGIMVRIDEAVRAGKSVVDIWGDPETTRCFVYVEDVAAAFVKAVDYLGRSHFPVGVTMDATVNNQKEICILAPLEPLPINVGSPHEITIKELAEKIAAEMKCKVNFRFIDRPGGHARRVASVMRAEAELGWKDTTSIEDGLRDTVAWYEKEGRAIPERDK